MPGFPSGKLSFGIRLWFFARLLPVTVAYRPLGAILSSWTPSATSPFHSGMASGEIVRLVKKLASKPLLMRNQRCLREGLLAFYGLRLAGHAPVLHFGLAAGQKRYDLRRAHCWISLGGQIVLNPPAEPMLELFAYDGTASTAAGASHA